MDRTERFAGCLIGSAVGDSLLLPMEGLPRSTIARRFAGPLRQRLVCGRGMVSDDTEHAFLATQALLAAGDDAARFGRALARRLRWWLLGLPAGCGKATGLGLLRSWCGLPPERSGVHSAGNGPAMRSAIIGLRWAHDRERRRSFVAISTTITHRDGQALDAALAVAEAAAWTAGDEPLDRLWERWLADAADPAWAERLRTMRALLEAGAPVDDLARRIGRPEHISAYALNSIPVALYAWLRHRHDPEACMRAVMTCGGDTDTMGAIAGALLGCDDGPSVFPFPLLRIHAWPMSLGTMRRSAEALARGDARPVRWCWPLQPLRNLGFLLVVLAHGFRRLLP
jgi:ADP-ribosyl-[dinitrogen reductase] hydrolase